MEYHRTSDQSFYTNYSSEDDVDEQKDNVECIIELIELRMQLEDMKFNGDHFYRGNLIHDELENIENELHHYGWYL